MCVHQSNLLCPRTADAAFQWQRSVALPMETSAADTNLTLR